MSHLYGENFQTITLSTCSKVFRKRPHSLNNLALLATTQSIEYTIPFSALAPGRSITLDLDFTLLIDSETDGQKIGATFQCPHFDGGEAVTCTRAKEYSTLSGVTLSSALVIPTPSTPQLKVYVMLPASEETTRIANASFDVRYALSSSKGDVTWGSVTAVQSTSGSIGGDPSELKGVTKFYGLDIDSHLRFKPRTLTSSSAYQITNTDNGLIVILTGGPTTITLPNATVSVGKQFTIKNMTTETITVSRFDSNDSIDGNASATIGSKGYLQVVCVSTTQWAIVASG